MNTIVRMTLVALLMIVAVPAFSGEAVQMWSCSLEGDTTEEQVEAMAKEWLDAAKKVEGGANLRAFVFFPVAVNATGEMDFMFVVVAPSFAEWGKFWDNYLISDDFAAMEKLHGDAIACPDSVVWDKIEVK